MGGPDGDGSVSNPVNAGTPAAKPLPKCTIMSVCVLSSTFTTNGTPSVSHPDTSRFGDIAIVICGGSNEHCCSQLASMPVVCSPLQAVTMNRPLGTRPR